MNISDIVTDALAKLDAEGSPDQVAARLDMDCAVGIRRSFTACPVAEWLLVTTGLRVTVGPEYWATVRDAHFALGELPDNVAGFVQGFDRELYPLLDDAKPV